MKGYIYKITLKSDPTKNYIGQTTNNLSCRFSQHKHYALRKNKKGKLYDLIRKYPDKKYWNVDRLLTINLEPIEKFNEWMSAFEAEFICQFDSFRNGLNSTEGGEIARHRGRPGLKGEKHPLYGKKRPEHSERMKGRMKGEKHPYKKELKMEIRELNKQGLSQRKIGEIVGIIEKRRPSPHPQLIATSSRAFLTLPLHYFRLGIAHIF